MSRGGSREGAGRKALSPSEKKVQITMYFSPDTIKGIKTLRSIGVNISEEISHLITSLLTKHNL